MKRAFAAFLASGLAAPVPAWSAGPVFDALLEAAPVPSEPAPEVPAALPASVDGFARRAEALFFRGRRGSVVAGPRRFGPKGVPGEGEMDSEVRLSPLTNPEREKAVVELFRQAGAPAAEIELQDAGRGRHNITVVKKGRTDRVVVVGGHHDKVSAGAGTIDNWTGATLVANLYQAVRDLDTQATFVFIAFAREEEGLVGSRFWLSRLPAERRAKIDSMVNLDTLAVDGTYSWKNNSDRVLLDMSREAAQAEKLGLAEVSFSGGDADSSTFRRAGIPAMTLFGASPRVLFDIIHSDKDTPAAFSLPHYKNAYLVALALLKSLDAKPARGGAAVAAAR